MIELALFSLAVALAETVLLFGAIPTIVRNLRARRRARDSDLLVRAGCGHWVMPPHGMIPLRCYRCSERRAS